MKIIYYTFSVLLFLQSCTAITGDSVTTPLSTSTTPAQNNSSNPKIAPDKEVIIQPAITIDANIGWSNIVFSPDGNTIASGNDSILSNGIDIWDVSTGKKIRTLGGHPAAILSVTFSPDGRFIASTGAKSEEVVKLWDVKTNLLIQTLHTDVPSIMSVAFSPDSKSLAVPGFDSIYQWNVVTGKQIRAIKVNSEKVGSIAFSPNGQILASSSNSSFDNTIKLRNIKSTSLLHTLQGHSKYINEFVFSPDGQTLASASSDNTIKIWNVKKGILLRTLTGHSYSIVSDTIMSGVNSVTFSPNGRMLASGAYDNTIKLWDIATGRQIHTLKGHKSGVNSVVFSPNGKIIASGSYDGTIKIWNLP